MKKIILTLLLVFAFLSSNVAMAQGTKGECPKAKTECPKGDKKACDKSKKCDKSEKKACDKGADKKACCTKAKK